ncbi:hypothetical protein H4O18_18590 [Arenibacter sp. BSSL-BM3]|uniref:Lipoprotein n=1 Tax=Arenibacter arenosicollis TaxID=2762274 RepID=A0ABR7QSG8_9FLAO|nr:hypothetical protein [Arenibacter arenosicollis]MBC8770014.1 hypothetical protein [Arenibacter arenosicollis]
MNKKAIIVFSIFFIVTISCKEKFRVQLDGNEVNKDICFTSGEREKIIKSILETPDF